MEYSSHRKPRKNWPDWVHESLKVFKPPERLTVSEWADKNRILDSKTSSEPGPWRTSRTPYLRKIMDSYNDPEIEEITFAKCTQSGGTEAINNMIGFTIDQKPASTLVVYPDEKACRKISKIRLEPMILLSPALNNHYLSGESSDLEFHFDGMYLTMGWSGSATALASMPCQNVFIDEPDKNKKNAGGEADPQSLARERTKNFTFDRKIVMACTPTFESGVIWKAWLKAYRQYHYFVPCPHCNEFQVFRFGQIKFDLNLSEVEIAKSAYYECVNCGKAIYDHHKTEMLEKGEWRTTKDEGKKRVAFHLNTIYSPWVTFGQIASKWKEVQNNPDELMNFVNSWLAEPWVEKEMQVEENVVLDRRTELPELIVPDWAEVLIGTADVQAKVIYFTIRAWGPFMTSQCIDYGYVERPPHTTDWDDLTYIMNRTYCKANGQQLQVQLGLIDSGKWAEDVYEYCLKNSEWARPIKGSSIPIPERYKISSVDRPMTKFHGMTLYIVDGDKYKDSIAMRMQRPNGNGSWMVHSNTTIDYARQITAEEKRKEKKGTTYIFKWKPKAGDPNNHYLDCEVYNYAGAEICLVRYLGMDGTKPNQVAQQINQQQQQNQSQPQNNWINNNNWLKNKGSWLR